MKYLIIIFVVILIMCVMSYYSNMSEYFYPYLNNNGIKKYMIRDIRTNYWLLETKEVYKFLPNGFGISLILPNDINNINNNDFLPLISDDEKTLSYNNSKIITKINPQNKFNVLQIFIYEGYNIIGYLDKIYKQEEQYKYIYIDDKGYIMSVSNPNDASKVEMVIL